MIYLKCLINKQPQLCQFTEYINIYLKFMYFIDKIKLILFLQVRGRSQTMLTRPYLINLVHGCPLKLGVKSLWVNCSIFLVLGTKDTDRWQINLRLCATCQCPCCPIPEKSCTCPKMIQLLELQLLCPLRSSTTHSNAYPWWHFMRVCQSVVIIEDHDGCHN